MKLGELIAFEQKRQCHNPGSGIALVRSLPYPSVGAID